ncbi:MAG: hypothetical protein DCC71_10455, partial [Proteobacteria bacterium]
ARRGFALLRALGAAARGERERAPARLDFAIAADGLDDALPETLRRAVLDVAGDWSETLEPLEGEPAAPRDAALARVASAWTASSAEIAGPALARLGSARFAADAEALVWTALGRAAAVPASRETRAWIERMPSRALRRLRRVLGSLDEASLERFDFGAWTHALQGLALARAVDRCSGDLRSAIECARAESLRADGDALPPEADLTPLATGAGTVRELVGRAVRAWLRSVAAA